jgi:Family of unknown function (DUF5985)
MSNMLLGMIAALSLVAGFIFLRYWLSTRDRFFILLALSFWVEAGNRMHMAVAEAFNEAEPVPYLIRLVSYGLILVAIWDKNRPSH